MIDHVSVQVDDVEVASAFYDAVLGVLGYRRLKDFGQVVGYGDQFPAFWIGAADPIENRQSHLAFRAVDRASVDAFFTVAVDLGAAVLHEPRVWPEYHPGYYGAFVRDPDGNNVEAVHHTFG